MPVCKEKSQWIIGHKICLGIGKDAQAWRYCFFLRMKYNAVPPPARPIRSATLTSAMTVPILTPPPGGSVRAASVAVLWGTWVAFVGWVAIGLAVVAFVDWVAGLVESVAEGLVVGTTSSPPRQMTSAVTVLLFVMAFHWDRLPVNRMVFKSPGLQGGHLCRRSVL